MTAAKYHREELKAVLRMRHGSLLAFERAKGLPRNSVKDVLRGRSVAQAELAIATEINEPLHRLFPHRYAAKADSPSAKVDNSDAAANAHRQNARAA
ncbi:MAG: helix-turn-helix domain-containing protein [Caulobacter sp.]